MRSLLFCLSLIVLLAACGRETELDRYARASEKELEWVETADAARLFEADNSSGKFRFLSMCGTTCLIPGVNRLNAEKCYPKVSVEKVIGTGDAYFSERQQQLQTRVWEFAGAYNLLVASSERANGRTTCDDNANWDDGFSALSKALRAFTGVDGVNSERLVSIARNSRTFEVMLPRNVPLQPLKDLSCAVLAEHGLSKEANVRFRIDNIEDGDWQEISCGAGSVI